MYYSPVCHSFIHPKVNEPAAVRLACIRHAASVHPEPGSNPPKNFKEHFYFKTQILSSFSDRLIFYFFLFFCQDLFQVFKEHFPFLFFQNSSLRPALYAD